MRTEIQFTREPIVIPPVTLSSREIGACAEFHGIVRELENGASIAGLYYEAYEPMARDLLSRHFAELSSLHPCVDVLFIHRLDWVPVGETSLYLRALAAHRGPALRFITDAIERLKLDVPIWKRAQNPHAA